jgi:hypothetical protein
MVTLINSSLTVSASRIDEVKLRRDEWYQTARSIFLFEHWEWPYENLHMCQFLKPKEYILSSKAPQKFSVTQAVFWKKS